MLVDQTRIGVASEWPAGFRPSRRNSSGSGPTRDLRAPNAAGVRSPHCSRMVIIGSVREPRRAGMKLASQAVAASSRVTAAKVRGSVGLTS